MALKVIGAGFGRTGTDSMRQALEILGLGPCHHMFLLTSDPERYELWKAVARGAAPDWTVLLRGFGSSVDWPTAIFWRELMELYPDAKVLLTWRDPESWHASMESSILTFITERPDSVGGQIMSRVFGGDFSHDHMIAVYRQNTEEVLASVPPGRLIVHRLGDGWGPLCGGLGLPVPDVPYPSGNSSAEFKSRNAL